MLGRIRYSKLLSVTYVEKYDGEEVEEEANVSGYSDDQKFTEILTLKLPTFHM